MHLDTYLIDCAQGQKAMEAMEAMLVVVWVDQGVIWSIFLQKRLKHLMVQFLQRNVARRECTRQIKRNILLLCPLLQH